MAIKKSDLYSSLWASCDELRGGMDADHPITLVDALLARLTRRLEVPVWTFDRHFITMRTRVWRPTTT